MLLKVTGFVNGGVVVGVTLELLGPCDEHAGTKSMPSASEIALAPRRTRVLLQRATGSGEDGTAAPEAWVVAT